MPKFPDLDVAADPDSFGRLVGISQQASTGWRRRGVLPPGGSLRTWIRAYVSHLVGVAKRRGAPPAETTAHALVSARIRESEAKAAKVEVEVAKELAALVYVGDLEPAVAEWSGFAAERIELAAAEIAAAVRRDFPDIALDDARHVLSHLGPVLRELAPPSIR